MSCAAVVASRREAPTRSSFPLEQLTLRDAGGGRTLVALKRLEWGGLTPAARLAKPRFLFDAAREPAVYESVLPTAPSGPPRLISSLPGAGPDDRWLLIEWVDGRELYQVGELELWSHAAAWLGEFHARLAGELDRHRATARLIEHDAAWYDRWLDRARDFAGGRADAGRARAFLDWLAQRYDAVIEVMLELPRTVVHGDFNAANVLVCEHGATRRIAPVDWELAGAAPGVCDLASLASGDWTAGERAAMREAYVSAPGVAPCSARQLDFARLALAVQWLGWAPPRWRPPPAQRHDWLADASAIAQELGL